MKLKRKEAITFAALINILNLTSSDKEEEMQNPVLLSLVFFTFLIQLCLACG
jgi:hypothetical protein